MKGQHKKEIAKKSEKTFLREIVISVFLALFVFALFSPAIRYGTVYYDDSDYVGMDNPHVPNGLTKDGIIWAFTTGHSANWHPLTWLSHMLDVEMFGNTPSGAHFTNILFHAINTALLFLVLKRMTGALWRSAFVAALFGLHPAHVESVAWISERKDVLSTFFWMLAIWFYAESVRRGQGRKGEGEKGRRTNTRPFYFLSLIFFALGLMSKPMVVTLPFVLLLLDFWPLQRVDLTRFHLVHWPLVKEKILFFILTIVSSVVTFIVQERDGAVSSLVALPLFARIENALVSYVRYMGKMFFPVDLAPLYPRPSDWPALQVCGATLLLVGISAWAIRSRRRQPWFFTGWFWFLGTLVPVIGLVQVGAQAMADRYTYIPLIGLFIVVTWLAVELFSRWNLPRFLLGAGGIIFLLVCTILTQKQISYWKDSESLFRHALKVTKNNYLAQNILGLFFSDHARYEDAISLYRESLESAPGFADAHNNLGYALAQIGNHEQAIKHLQLALKIKPGYVDAHNNLGISLAAMGRIDEAISHYEMALAKEPKFPEAHNNLGIALLTRGDSELAIEHLRAACQFKPDYLSALNGLAWILATHSNPKFRDGNEAVQLASRAVELTKGKDAGVLETLAAAHAESGDFPNALKSAQSALALAKANLDAEMSERLESELQMYGENQPYRDPDMKEN